MLYIVEAIDRATGLVTVADYATFDTYTEAREFADREEAAFRQCGWTAVVTLKSAE